MVALKIKNLKKIYINNKSNGFEALKDINLEIKKGDFFALLGPNGAGKSTLIGIITSLITKSTGSIKILNYDLVKDNLKVKDLIGVVPQEFNFNIWETIENILINQAGYFGIPRVIAIKRAEKLLKKFDLYTKRKTIAKNLSGGMKRKLMIIRALIHSPKILILDEPTAGVDIEIRRLMWKFLKELNKNGITIILTTHYLEEAENLCNNIAIINKGIIIKNTSMKNLLSKLDKEIYILNLKNKLENNFEFKTKFIFKKIDSKTLEVSIFKNENINDLFKELKKLNIEVLSIKNKTNHLEEFFINIIEDNKNEN